MENQQNNEDNKGRQRLYKQYVKEANDRIKLNQESQDKMILTISVALFGLLPFILEKIPINYFTKFMIVILLVFNILALIAVLLSFYFCLKGNEKSIEYVEKYFLEKNEEYFNKKSCWDKIGQICNSASLMFFAITLIIYGIIMGVIFISK